MNNTQKILIAIGVGVGVALLYRRYKKNQSIKSASVSGSFQLPEDTATISLSREDKEEFILDNVSATPKEVASGFEGTRFVWNPTINKMYPVGTIEEGKEPAYVDAVFLSAEGEVIADIPQSVSNAEKTLAELNDQEVELLFRIVKKQKENPSIISEEDSAKELGITNPNIIKVIQDKLKKVLNDIKIMKKDASWNEKWEMRKQMRKKQRKDFRDKMGFEKSQFDRLVMKQCGRKPRILTANYKKCVENIADKLRADMKEQIRKEVGNAPVSVKAEISDDRQKSFEKQIQNRTSGGMVAGQRVDGKSNEKVESLVDKGLV